MPQGKFPGIADTFVRRLGEHSSGGFTYRLLAQRAYMIQVRHVPDQPTIRQTIHDCLPIGLTLIVFGSFAVVTHLLKWPKWRSSRVSDPT